METLQEAEDEFKYCGVNHESEMQHNNNSVEMRVWSSQLELWFVVLTGSWCCTISRLASSSAPLPIMRLFGSGIDSMSPSVFHSSSAKTASSILFPLIIYLWDCTPKTNKEHNKRHTRSGSGSARFFFIIIYLFFLFFISFVAHLVHLARPFSFNLFDGGWNFWVELNWM